MASAGVVESLPKVPSRTFYQIVRETIPLLAVNHDRRASRSDQTTLAEPQDESKPRENSVAALESSDSQKHSEGKPKSKFGKKKEIVSSSTVVPRLEVCIGKKCKAKGSEDLLAEFQTASSGRVEIAYTKCMKECKMGMNARVTKDGTTFEWHHELTTADVEPTLCKHFDW